MNVIYGVDKSYLIPALISAYSVWKNASHPVDITIFGEGLCKQDHDAIHRVSNICGNSIKFQRFDSKIFDDYIHNRPKGVCYPAVGMLPLILPKIFSGRCLFIDADTLVLGDVWELLSQDLDGMAIGACPDMGMLTIIYEYVLGTRVSDILHPSRSRMRRNNRIHWILNLGFMPRQNYFNAGVLIIDCDSIRSSPPHINHDKLSSMDELRPHYCYLRDQDRLNEFFAKRWFNIHIRWNLMPSVVDKAGWRRSMSQVASNDIVEQVEEGISGPKIFHFTTYKPWVKSWRISPITNRYTYRAFNAWKSTKYELEASTRLIN